ncbi:VIT1/CCC1 transporter family protein, partial [Campylobacter concisus]
EERRHYAFCQKITGESRSANLFKVIFYTILVKIFGTSFTLKFMESREENAEKFYLDIVDEYPEARDIYEEEMNHENSLISMLKDTKLVNAGGIVLGMNDALVELTGTLSGIALAFSNTKSVGSTGLIMGVAAALSMAGSAYLESKENPSDEIKPLTYSLYT